jgi:hypothetical protein
MPGLIIEAGSQLHFSRSRSAPSVPNTARLIEVALAAGVAGAARQPSERELLRAT